MARNIWKPVLSLGAVLAFGGISTAGDPVQLSGGPAGSTTMTLGGIGSVEQAATENLELTHGGRYRGYYGWGGGWGYRGYYGGWNRGWGGGWGGYRPAYWGGGWGGGWGGYRPAYWGGGWGGWGGYRPAYWGGGWGGYYNFRPAYFYSPAFYRCGPSIYLGIAGEAGSGAPVVNLGSPFVPPQMTEPLPPSEGTFRYDGGPANPVPRPMVEPQPIAPANPSADLPISGIARPAVPAASPYKYKAYGEK